MELSRKNLIGKARERPDLVRQVLDTAMREGLAASHRAVAAKLNTETAVGYSSAGVVTEVGSRVAGLSVGDRVACAGEGHASHAEIVEVPRNLVASVPKGVQLDQAAFATLGAIALHATRLAEVDIGSQVAVVGCGLIGQIALRLLAAAGIETIAIDLDPSRIESALFGGADHGYTVSPDTGRRILEATGGIGVDATIVAAAASSSEPLELGCEVTRDRGSVVLLGAVPIELPREPLYRKELRFRVSRSYGPGRYDREFEERGLDYPIGFVRWTQQRNMATVLSLLGRGKLSFADLVSDVVPVENAALAYDRLVAGGAGASQGAILIRYSESSASSQPVEPEERPAKPSTAARVALIGPGSFAQKVLVPALTAAGVSLAVAASGHGASAESAERRLGFKRSTTPEAAISDPSVDAVIIATRHCDHARLVAEALAHDKHVFVEKPLALTEDELDHVLAVASNSEATLAVGLNRRFAPFVRAIQELLAQEPGAMSAHYRVSAGRIDANHWIHDPEEGGGRLIGEACHFVDTLRFLVGAPVTEVYARAFGAATTPLVARDNATITLSFADGSIGTILYAANGSRRLPKERLEAFKGGVSVVLDDFKTVDFLREGKRTRRKARTQDKGHRAEIEAFIAGVRAGRPPVPIAEIENVSRATLAIVESLRTGLPVVL
jgi:polar amino acid transport system substrate-binding protein